MFSKRAFDRWAYAKPGRIQLFVSFNNYLVDQGVHGVVPTWQLLRANVHVGSECGGEAFIVPPEHKWRAIVPTLRLVRSHIVPVVGRVEVNSGYRDPAFNECSGGAKRSRHMDFSALDLIAPDHIDKELMFRDLCRLHMRVGRKTSMGLGAYYDPKNPQWNQIGQFHIDATGFRTWGFDYTRKSTACQWL